MTKFHVSADGNPRSCNAKQGNCPLAGDDKHFDTAEAARTDYEKTQGASFATVQRTTQATRMAKLPEVKGIKYEPDFDGDGVSDAGIKFSSIKAFRERRNGSHSRIASITVYDDGTAIVWDRTSANEADIKARGRLLGPLKESFEISPYSSPIFRL